MDDDEFDGHAAEETGDRFWVGFWLGAICGPLAIICLFAIWISMLPVS